MDTTVLGIAREVRTRITDGLRPTEAAREVAVNFVGDENGKLRALLDSGLLTLAFRQAEQMTLHSDPLYVAGGDPLERDTQLTAEASRHTRYDAFYAKPYDLILPVLGTGDRKRLGEFTQQDCMAVGNYMGANAETYRKAARVWKRVAKKVGDLTVEDVWHELSEDDQKLIGR